MKLKNKAGRAPRPKNSFFFGALSTYGKRITALCLVFILCLAFTGTVMAAGQDTEEELKAEIARLNALVAQLRNEIRNLENALDTLVTSPPSPVQRRPLILVTEPLLVEVAAGERKTVEFNLQNLASDTGNQVITTADLSEAQGITGVFLDSNNNVSSMGARAQRKFSYRITVNETVAAGFYTITFNHECRNLNNEIVKSESRVTIRVTSPGGDVSVRDIASSLSRVPQGQDFDLTAVIRNGSPLEIKDVSLTIANGMSPDGVFLRASTNVVGIANMRAGHSENISIGFTAAQKARSGAYPLLLELSYTDSRGERHKQEYTFFVSVGGGAGQESASEVIITNITYPRGAVGVGQEFEMVVTLKNTGKDTARNIRVDAVADSERAIVPRSTSRLLVPTLGPDAERQVSFRFAPTALGSSRNYDLGFAVSYETGMEGADGDSQVITFTQYQGVNVSNPEGDDDETGRISTPRIIVSDYKSDPLIVQAGKEFDLALSFLNTSSRPVRNIRVTLTVEEEVMTGSERRGSVFTPVGRSSTFFIDAIEPKGEAFEYIKFYTLPDAPPRNYIINVNFEYEDADNNPFEARERIGINVKQVTKLDISEIFMQDYANVYEPIFLNFELYNTGRVTLSNLMIRVEGNFNSNQSSSFYGSLSPGSMDYYDNVLTPIEPGPQELTIVISYEDDTGEQIEERKVFSLDVMESMGGGGWDVYPPFGDDMVWDDRLGMFVPASSGASNIVLIAIVAGGALVIAGATVLIVVLSRRKRRRRLAEELD